MPKKKDLPAEAAKVHYPRTLPLEQVLGEFAWRVADVPQQLLAEPDGSALWICVEHEVRCWEIPSGKERCRVRDVQTRSFTVLGEELFTASNGRLTKWDAKTGKRLASVLSGNTATATVALREVPQILTGAKSACIANEKYLTELGFSRTKTTVSEASPRGTNVLWFRRGEGKITVLEIASGTKQQLPIVPKTPAVFTRFINEKTLLVAYSNGRVSYFEHDKVWKESWSVEQNEAPTALEASSGQLFVVGGKGFFFLRRQKDGTLVKKIARNDYEFLTAIPKTDAWIAIASSAGNVRVVDVQTGRELAGTASHTGPVRALSWSPKSDSLASMASSDPVVRSWNLEERSNTSAFEVNERTADPQMQRSPDGNLLAIVTEEQLNVWDLRTGERLNEKGLKCLPRGFVWTADGNHLVVLSEADASVFLWDPRTGEEKEFTPSLGVNTYGAQLGRCSATQLFVLCDPAVVFVLRDSDGSIVAKYAISPDWVVRSLHMFSNHELLGNCQTIDSYGGYLPAEIFRWTPQTIAPAKAFVSNIFATETTGVFAIDPLGLYIAHSQRSNVLFSSLTTGRNVATIGLSAIGDEATALSFSPDGSKLSVGTSRGLIFVFGIDRQRFSENE